MTLNELVMSSAYTFLTIAIALTAGSGIGLLFSKTTPASKSIPKWANTLWKYTWPFLTPIAIIFLIYVKEEKLISIIAGLTLMALFGEKLSNSTLLSALDKYEEAQFSIASILILLPFLIGFAAQYTAETVLTGSDRAIIVDQTNCETSFAGKVGNRLAFYDRQSNRVTFQLDTSLASLNLLGPSNKSCPQ